MGPGVGAGDARVGRVPGVLAATLFAHESAMLGVHGAAGLGDAGCLGSGLAGVTWVACYLVSPAGCSWAGRGVSRLRVCRTGARAGSVGLGGCPRGCRGGWRARLSLRVAAR